MTREQDITRCLVALQENGDAPAADELFRLLYEDLRAIAGGLFRGQRAEHTLQPTAVVHDCYLRLVRQSDVPWTGRAHFLAVAAKAMRRILINHERDRRAAKRAGGAARIALVDDVTPASAPDVDLLALDEALRDLDALNERQARIVELRFFGGLTNRETAHVLGVSLRTVEGGWSMARAWLHERLHSGHDAG